MIKKVLGGLYWCLLLILAFVALVLFLSNLEIPFKVKVFSVQSGSMFPSVPMGSLIVVKQFENYAIGDVITFRNTSRSKETTTHRISKVKRDQALKPVTFSTKGDSNDADDSGQISAESVLGKVIFSVPLVGFPLLFVKTLPGFISLIIIPATIIIYSELLNIKVQVLKTISGKKKSKEKISSLI
ncbi:MAG: signal peptidase I [Patescibacteria group bacterium]